MVSFIQLSVSDPVIGKYNDVIYYYEKYYPVSNIRDNGGDTNLQTNSNLILDLKSKTRHYEYSRSFFSLRLKRTLVMKDVWHICSVPSHSKGKRNTQIEELVDYCNLPGNYLRDVRIVRSKEMVPKHNVKQYGPRTIEKDLSSMTVEGNIRNSNIIVLDDVTTSGSSLIAASQLLKKNGANNIILLALAKTVRRDKNVIGSTKY